MRNKIENFILSLIILISCSFESIGQTANNQVIVKINYSYLNFDVINDKQTLEFPLRRVLNDRAKAQLIILENQIPGIADFQLTKIFPFLSTYDTVSISRLGQKVTIPPFWATFTL